MILRKITPDNSLKYVPSISINSSQSEISHDHRPKTVSNPKKPNEKTHKTKRNSLKIS